MLRNYFTLYHLARELHERLSGGYVFEVFSQRKNEIVIAFVTPEGGHLQVHVVAHRPELCIFTREGLNRKKRDTVALMPEISEKEVLSVSIDPGDRIIYMEIGDGSRLMLQLFGATTNVLLEREGRITPAFRKHSAAAAENETAEERKGPEVLRTLEPIANDPPLFVAEYLRTKGRSESEKLREMLPGFDRRLVRELLSRSGENPSPERLGNAFTDLFYELIAPSPSVYTDAGGSPGFTILGGAAKGAALFDTVLEALNAYSLETWKHLDTRRLASELLRQLQRKRKKIESERENFDPRELRQRAGEYERYGHILIAGLGCTDREPESIVLDNVLDPSSPPVTVPLKPELNLQENAARWFIKASKTREKLHGALLRAAQVEKQREEIETLVPLVEKLSSPTEVGSFYRTHRTVLKQLGLLPPEKQSGGRQAPFRRIDIAPKAVLYVGKNARNNERLTFSFAKPRDIWLHARGASGSHCVLRGAAMHNLTEIRRAAEIAAYHSSARNSELVPVMYCEKKHVRRSKKLPPGQVVVEKEKIILVKPLP